jgi:Neuraminidase (sialidase)
MKKHYFLLLILILVKASFGQYKNVQLPIPRRASYSYSQVEPSIFVNPHNTDEVIAGTVMNDYYWSADGGETWKSRSIKSKYGVNGDPCMLIDTLGRYFYFHLSSKDGEVLKSGMVSQYSKKLKGKFKYQGHTLDNGKFHDKEWVALNPKNNHIYMTWTQFDAYDSEKPKDRSNILFSKTADGGLTWSFPKIISSSTGDCKDNDKTAEGAVPAVGPNGEIYCSWARNDSIFFNSSFDEGETWKETDQLIATQPNGWVIDIPGIFRCNGLPVTACDLSTSSHNGTIYVNWADQRNGVEDTDIWIIKSTDKGKSWTEPNKVNTDKSKHHQFLTWMTIDQTNGYVYCVFYDRRNHSDRKTDVFLAVSKDGGENFENFKISETPFEPNPKVFFGDYTNISVHKGVIRPIWTRLHNAKISVHTALIKQSDLEK